MYQLVIIASVLGGATALTDYTQYVQPFLGTESGGNMFPGVARPFGIVKLGPDLYTGVDAYSGYLPSGNVTGFTMTHMSGTGGAPKYGVVNQMPASGTISNPLLNATSTRASADQASVGYYKTSLSSGITVELAASNHAGLYRYNFSGSYDTSNIVVDVSHVLSSYRGQGLSQQYAGGNITTFTDGHYELSGTYNNGWNRSPNWVIYACGRFSSKPTAAKVFKGSGTTLDSYGTSTSASGTTERVGAVFTFPAGATILSRVGISWISTAQACKNVDTEIPSALSFDSLVSQTSQVWNSQVLSKATISSTNTNDLQLFYSMMYGTFLVPSNRTGENPKWQSSEPYYDDTFTLWDLHRCSTSLWQVLQPTFYEEYIRSLIDIWRHDSYLPDGRSSNFNGRTQGGSNADNVLADAYVKGVRGKVNWADGYSAMVKDAEVIPVNNNDPMAPDSSTKEGRGALPDYKQYGWITPTYSRAVSRALEYSVNDFALSQVASGLGKSADKTKYITRSKNWRNHWNSKATSLGFNGFLVPRNADGSFQDQDPLSCGGCYWGDAYYQATPWEYSWGAHHDIGTIIKYTGSSTNFVNRLEKMFEGGANPGGSSQFNYTIVNPSNEPDFATPYLYNFANRQDLSVQRSRYIAKTYYNTGNAGLPGNSDAGAMQTWLLWNMIGLYPLTGQTTFLIHAPWFGVSIDLGGGKSLKITTTGGNSDTAFYVQSLKVNGKDWKQNWLTWSDVFANGGTMDFVLGASPSKWFTGPAPPSPASGY